MKEFIPFQITAEIELIPTGTWAKIMNKIVGIDFYDPKPTVEEPLKDLKQK